jgi:hypothetical protein
VHRHLALLWRCQGDPYLMQQTFCYTYLFEGCTVKVLMTRKNYETETKPR